MMKDKLFSCLIVVSVLAGHVFCGDDEIPSRSLLTRTLFRVYDSRYGPLSENGAVELTFRPIVNRIISTDPASSTAKLEMYLYYFWNDPALVWDPSVGFARLVVDIQTIWTPSINMHLLSGTESLASTIARPFATLYPSGDVYVFNHVISEVPCTQTEDGKTNCTLKYSLYNYLADEVALFDLNKESEDISAHIVNGEEWGVVSAKFQHEAVQYDCCPETFHSMVTELIFDKENKLKTAN
ncbi:acetylcholine receptor subunit alpha-type acr-15-like [Glandiceps talaboti]